MKPTLDYPWLDQSAIRSFYSCRRKFKFSVLDHRQQDTSFEYIIRGQEYHNMFNMFFDTVDLDEIVKLAKDMKILDAPDQTELFKYFTRILASNLDNEFVLDDGMGAMTELNIYGFARFQVMVIMEIIMQKGHVSKVLLEKYFLPKGREVLLKDNENKLYGVLDAWYDDADGGRYNSRLQDWKATSKAIRCPERQR